MKRIFFTGGGTAGHVTPNIALIEAVQGREWICHYVGSKNGVERELTSNLDLPFHGIYSGKLRRYFDWQNFIDPIFIILGCIQSLYLCLRHRPDIVFSKGGFVAVPVVFAAWLCRIPVISHESDITPGLANKLSLPFARRLCVNFAKTLDYLPPKARNKVEVTGSPLRAGLLNVDAERGRAFLDGKAAQKGGGLPLLFVVGGSLGAKAINECIWQNISWLTEQFEVVHIVGKGNLNSEVAGRNYHQFEYLNEQYGDVLALADFVVSRAGANAIYELLAFEKPHILIPLTAAASRGDQLVNARIMSEASISRVIQESELTSDVLSERLQALREEPVSGEKMKAFAPTHAVEKIVSLLETVS